MKVGVSEKLETSILSYVRMMRVVTWIVRIKKILLTRKRQESLSVVGAELQQGRLSVSMLKEVRK